MGSDHHAGDLDWVAMRRVSGKRLTYVDLTKNLARQAAPAK